MLGKTIRGVAGAVATLADGVVGAAGTLINGSIAVVGEAAGQLGDAIDSVASAAAEEIKKALAKAKANGQGRDES